MNITATENNGKHTAQVSKGGRIAFQSPEYLTEAMALADAKCWMAFHGEAELMDEFVKPGDRFTARHGVTHEAYEINPAELARRIAEARNFNLDVVEKTGPKGNYIEIGRNGCSYGQYHRVA